MRNLLTEFRQFILRGNVVDLAVGIVIGVAFSSVVQGLVRDLINPLIAALFGQPDFTRLHFTLNHAVFSYGDFITRVITLAIIGASGLLLRGQAGERDDRPVPHVAGLALAGHQDLPGLLHGHPAQGQPGAPTAPANWPRQLART